MMNEDIGFGIMFGIIIMIVILMIVLGIIDLANTYDIVKTVTE